MIPKVRGRTAAAAVAFLLLPSSAGARQYSLACTDSERRDLDEVAHQMAPTLNFAPGELHFPTIPFFTALDGSDNDDDGRIDFDDPDEIAPIVEGEAISWRKLDSLYHATWRSTEIETQSEPSRAFPPGATVFYRKRLLDAAEQRRFWRFLASDLQAWDRLDVADVHAGLPPACPGVAVIEYYMYYADDNGLEGHEEDIEFVFVFVPLARNATPFRVTVGAGHDNRTPNNVLFESPPEGGGPSVLVELHGHGSSPDAEPTRVFQPGVDVNVHAAEAWGTRDQLALTGEGFLGRYRSEFTLAGRERGYRLAAASRGLDPSGYTGRTGYTLLDVEVLRRVYGALESGDRREASAALNALREKLPGVSDRRALTDEQMERVLKWREPLCCGRHEHELGVSRRLPWMHKHYVQRATTILKGHLYRPSISQLNREKRLWLDQVGFTAFGNSGGLGGAAFTFVLPIFRISGLYLPGFITVEGGWSNELSVRDARTGFYAGAVLDQSFKDWYGWYVAARRHGVRRKTPSECEVARCEGLGPTFELGGGLSALVYASSRSQWWNPVRRVRLRLGLAVQTAWARSPQPPQVEMQVSLR